MELSKSEVSKIVKQLKSGQSEDGKNLVTGGFLPPVLLGLGVAGLTALVSELGKLMAPIIADKVRKVVGNGRHTEGAGVKLTGQGLMLSSHPSAKPRARAMIKVHQTPEEVKSVPTKRTYKKKTQPEARISTESLMIPVIEPPPS